MTYNSYQLQEVCSFIDYRGKTPPKTTAGVPLITAKIIKNGTILPPQEFIAIEYYDEWMRKGIPKKGSIVFTTEAPLGEVAQIKTDERIAFAQRVVILEPNPNILDANYLLYALQDQVLKERINARATGTTVVGIKVAELKKVNIDLPSLENQKRISDILCAFDDKIELNQRINDNLERQAQTFYANWCGQSDKFIRIGDIVDNVFDYTPNRHNEVVLINSSDVTAGHWEHHTLSRNENLKGHFKKRFAKFDILYSEIRPKNKHFAYVLFDTDNYIASTRLMVIRAKQEMISPSLLYQHLSSERVCDEFASTTETRSGTFPQGCFADFANIAVPFRPVSDQTGITTFLDGVYKTIEHNDSENRYLVALRDTILPKLMSGEIDVSAIQL